jgi:hypothetical protein
MKRLILILFALGVGLSAGRAFANLTLKLDLETKLQEKVRSLIAPVDPYAQVVISVRLKQLAVELPGAGAQLAKIDSSHSEFSLSLEDIERVEISVISKLNPFPAGLRRTLESGIDLPASKKRLTIQAFDAETAALLAKPEPDYLKTMNAAEEAMGKIVDRAPSAFGWILAGLAVFALLRDLGNQRARAKAAGRIAEGLKELSSREAEAVSVPPRPADSPGVVARDRGGDSDTDRLFVQSLPPEALTALFSDCYWCMEDGYAAWLWASLTQVQREALLRQWPKASIYVRSLGSTESKVANYHHHPYYLEPLRIQDVSQNDIMAWVKAHPGAWHALSPMRKMRSGFSLLEKIKLNEVALHAQLPAVPRPSRDDRELSEPMDCGSLTEADELEILRDPTSVPASLRPQIQSAVWTALLDEQARREVLSSMSARMIAEVWLGPDAVLEKMAESLPEKKLQLVKRYRSRIQPYRTSDAMSELVRVSLERLADMKPRELQETGLEDVDERRVA